MYIFKRLGRVTMTTPSDPLVIHNCHSFVEITFSILHMVPYSVCPDCLYVQYVTTVIFPDNFNGNLKFCIPHGHYDKPIWGGAGRWTPVLVFAYPCFLFT